MMNSIELLLLDMPQTDRAVGCDDDEIRRLCRACKRLFQCLDLLVHHCQQPFGTLTDSDMNNVRKLVALLDRLWRRLHDTVPPKAHAWWHLVADLDRLRGLKHHQESKIEVSHQIGRKIDLLFRSVNDTEKKIDASLRYLHTSDDQSMKKVQETVKESRSRKRKSVDAEDAGRHGPQLEALDWPEIEDLFLSLTELAMIDRASCNLDNNNMDQPQSTTAHCRADDSSLFVTIVILICRASWMID